MSIDEPFEPIEKSAFQSSVHPSKDAFEKELPLLEGPMGLDQEIREEIDALARGDLDRFVSPEQSHTDFSKYEPMRLRDQLQASTDFAGDYRVVYNGVGQPELLHVSERLADVHQFEMQRAHTGTCVKHEIGDVGEVIAGKTAENVDVLGEKVQDTLPLQGRDDYERGGLVQPQGRRVDDRLLVLEGGRLVGDGPHEELLATCDLYRRLWESQLLATPS